MSRHAVVAIVVLGCFLAAAIVAVAVLAVRLADEEGDAAAVDKQDLPDFTKCDDIAIIGAGISGSYAAWRLRNRNLKVALYEYSNRIGGRCHTVKLPGIPDVNVEMGAMRFFPNEHPLLNRTVHELGLNMVDFVLGYGVGGDTLYYLRGEHLKYSELPTKAPYKLPDKSRIDFNTLLWEVFDNFTTSEYSGNEKLLPENRQKIKSLDGVELTMQSRRIFDAKYLDTETAQYISDASSFKNVHSELSAANWLPISDPRLTSGPNPVPKTVQQGFQAIPETMVQQFLDASSAHRFHRNHHLRSIFENEDGNYVLTFQPTETQAGVTSDDKSASTKRACAKKVVLAIPKLALQHLDWKGLKEDTVKDMLDNAVRDSPGAKMYFGYDDAWWRNLSLAAPYAVSTTPLRQTYDYAESKSTAKAVLNPSYTDMYMPFWEEIVRNGDFLPTTDTGDMSIAMSNTSVYLARKLYAEIFNLTVDDVPQPKSAVMALWTSYPYIAAWYEWNPGYRWGAVETRMLKPSDTDDVFIASNIFSVPWAEGGLDMVEKMLKIL